MEYIPAFRTQYDVIEGLLEAYLVSDALKKPLHPMISRGIFVSSDEDGESGTHKTANKKTKVRFHTGTRLHHNLDPARERADIPPRWRAQSDIPRGTGGG